MIATQSLTSTQPPRALIVKRYLPAALWLFYSPSCFQLYQSLFSGFFFIPVPDRWDRGWGMDRELGKREGITISLLQLLTSLAWASSRREVCNAAVWSGRDSTYPALTLCCVVFSQAGRQMPWIHDTPNALNSSGKQKGCLEAPGYWLGVAQLTNL